MLNVTRGAALPIALLVAAIIAAFTLIVAQNLQTDARTQVTSAQITRSVALARGGTNAGFAALRGALREELSATVGATANPASRWAYGTSLPTATEPTADSAASSLAAVQTNMQTRANALLCNAPIRSSNGDTVTLRLHFTATACGQAIPAGTALTPARFLEGGARTVVGMNSSQTYSIPYVLVATGTVTGAQRTIATQGEYRFTLGRTSFSRYALFTHIHTTSTGGNVVFTDGTLFNGPVHTNGNFVFARGNPYFASYVTSAGCTDNATAPPPGTCPKQNPGAYISTGFGTGFSSAATFPTNIQTSCQLGGICPQFDKGYDLNATYMPMPTSNANLRDAGTTGGIYLPGDAQVHLWTGGTTGAVSNGGAEYQYIATCPTTATSRTSTGCVTYRVKDGKIQRYTGPQAFTNNAAWTAATAFNGVIHSDGKITRLAGPTRTDPNSPTSAAPAVHRDSNITISATNDVRITTDLRYENQPCTGSLGRNSNGTIQNPDCSNTDAKNVLGVYSQSGSVLVGTSYASTCTNRSFTCAVVNPLDHAPNNVTINGVLMSATREVAVERHDVGPDRGQVNLLGGMIEYYYGAVGTVNGHGFGRSITYDTRMLAGLSPSAFPNTYTDEVKSIFTYAFGEREQP